jgi:hypothetical protein
MEVNGQLQSSAALLPGKEPRRRLDEPQNWFGKRGEK